MKRNLPRPGFELGSLIPFPATVTVTVSTHPVKRITGLTMLEYK